MKFMTGITQRNKIKLYSSLLYFSFSLFSFNLFAQNKIIIQADSAKDVINKNIYGHFAEHLGRCIYDGIYVGDSNKTIPNSNGIRNDIVDALKKLKVPVLRWPGGCFADTYHWKDGIGPKDKRPSMVNRWWGGVTEDNSFGTHDFLNFCEMIGAEPYLAGNVATGSVQEYSDWIQYVNGAPNTSPMSKWRVQNGREKPWNVNIWGVGNEAWGCGGNMKPEYYANLFRQYSTFMSGWSNETHIFRVASGANSDDYNWTETLMKSIPLSLIEGVALHHYSLIDWNHKGSSTNFSEEQYFKVIKSSLKMEELVTRHAAIMDKYDPRKKVALVVDEWGGWYEVEPGTNPGFLYQQNTMRDAVIAGVTLNIFNNHCDRVRMANLAQMVNVLQAVVLTNKAKMILTPTYHVMEMYNVHQNAKKLPLKVETQEYHFGTENLPAVSASASKDSNGVVHISIVNIDAHQTQNVSVQLDGNTQYKKISGRLLTSASMQDYNSFSNPEKIKPVVLKNLHIDHNLIDVKVEPYSVLVLELK